jgi:hypothetical protein
MIDLRFVRGYGPDSCAISVVGHGDFSHVDAQVPVEGIPNVPWPAGSLVGSRSDKVGGKPAGLQCRPFGYEKVKKAVTFHLPATEEQSTAFWAHLYSEEGYLYDKPGIIAYAFNTNWHRMGEFYCSAAILDALQAADWIGPLYSQYWEINPVALANLVSARLGVTWEASSTAALPR